MRAQTGIHISLIIEDEQPQHTEDDSAPTQPTSDPASHPLVQEAAKLFNAKVVRVEPKRR